jgi:thymidylate kinase
MTNTNASGIILEGIAGTGKTTLLRALLDSNAWSTKSHMSSIVLTEHQTLRVLESRRDNNSYNKSDSINLLSKHASYIHYLKTNLDNTEWLQRDRTNQQVSFIFERFHLSHVYHYEQLEWRDVETVDNTLKDLDAKMFIFTIDENDIQERIIDDYEKAGWKDYLGTLGNTDDEIIAHFVQKQNELLDLAKLTAIPFEIINTSILSQSEVLKLVVESPKYAH